MKGKTPPPQKKNHLNICISLVRLPFLFHDNFAPSRVRGTLLFYKTPETMLKVFFVHYVLTSNEKLFTNMQEMVCQQTPACKMLEHEQTYDLFIYFFVIKMLL